jgi:multiple sugar transport system permease protein
MIKKSTRERLKIWLTNFLLILGLIIIMLPFAWVLSTALKSPAETFKFPPQWIPSEFRWDNFQKALTFLPFHKFFLNTLYIIFWVSLGGIFSNMVAAYSFARLRFYGREVLFMIMLSTMMIPYHVTLIPMFVLFQRLGWIDTFKPLIIPSMFATPFFTFLARQYMMTIPYELDEAARIDGCNTWQILFKILLPLCKPVITIISVFTFLDIWGDFLGPLIYLNDESKYTISLGLALFRGRFFTHWNLMMAASLVVCIPPLIIYYLAQDYIIGGIASVGIKG